MLSRIKRFLKKSEIDSIKASSLFDARWYASEYEINLPQKELLSHYLVEGHLQGFDPSASFNGEAYRRLYLNNRANPLVHYLNEGRYKGYLKAPSLRNASEKDVLVAVSKGINEAPIVRMLSSDSVFFAEWYAQTYCLTEDTKDFSLYHFIIFGSDKGLDPNPYFSTTDYLKNNVDVEKEMTNPFYHFLASGRNEGRRVNYSSGFAFENEILDKEVLKRQEAIDTILFEGTFDLAWFNKVYNFKYKMPRYAILHYLVGNYDYRLDPYYAFNTLEYIRRYDDVKKSHINPYLHYIKHGKQENRSVALSKEARESHINEYLRSIKLKPNQKKELELVGRSRFFSFEFYCRLYKELRLEKSQCAKHYYLLGAFEGKDPSALFSSSYYLSAHKDILESGMNPLVHYLLTQKTEGRKISHSKSAKTDLFGGIIESESNSDGYTFPSLLPDVLSVLDRELEEKGILSDLDVNTSQLTKDYAWDQSTISAFKDFASEFTSEKFLVTDVVNESDSLTLDLAQNRSHNAIRLGLNSSEPKSLTFVLLQRPLSTESTFELVIDSKQVTAKGRFYVDLSLANPFTPALILVIHNNQVVDGLSFPFPSLLDGGLHDFELGFYTNSARHTVAEYDSICEMFKESSANTSRDVSRMWKVDLKRARGFEPIFDCEFKLWLKEYWKVDVCYVDAENTNPELRDTLSRCDETTNVYLPGEVPSIHFLVGLAGLQANGSQHILCRNKQQRNLSERHLRKVYPSKEFPSFDEVVSALCVDAAEVHINNILGAANLLELSEIESDTELHLVLNYKTMLTKQLSAVLQMLERQKGIRILSLSLIVTEAQKLNLTCFNAWKGIDIRLYRQQESQSYHSVLEMVFSSIGKGRVVLFSDNVYMYNSSTLASLVNKLSDDVKIVSPLLVQTKLVKNKECLEELNCCYNVFYSEESPELRVSKLKSDLAIDQNSFVEATSSPVLIVDSKSALSGFNFANQCEDSGYVVDEAQSLFLITMGARLNGASIVSANRLTVGCEAPKACEVEQEWVENILPFLTKEWE